MVTALSWLQPGPLAPLVATAADGPWVAGPRYEGLLTPTVDDDLGAVDLLSSTAGRAASLAARVPAGAAVARLSAVWVHTGRHRPGRLVLLLPATGPRGRGRGSVHRQVVGPTDVASYGGVAVTTPLRTAVDLLCFADGVRAQRGVTALLNAGLDPGAVLDRLDTPPARVPGARARRRLRALMTPLPEPAPARGPRLSR